MTSRRHKRSPVKMETPRFQLDEDVDMLAPVFLHPKSVAEHSSHDHLGAHFLEQPILAGDFQALGERKCSTSTPFQGRTVAMTSTQDVSPCVTNVSLHDSAIETFCDSPLMSTSVITKGSPGLYSLHPQEFHEGDTIMPLPKSALYEEFMDCSGSSNLNGARAKSIASTSLEHSLRDQCVPDKDSNTVSLNSIYRPASNSSLNQLNVSSPNIGLLRISSSPESQTSNSPAASSKSPEPVFLPKSDVDHEHEESLSTFPELSFQSYNRRRSRRCSMPIFFNSRQHNSDTGYESQLSFDMSSSSDISSMPYNLRNRRSSVISSSSVSEGATLGGSIESFLLSRTNQTENLIGRKMGLEQIDILGELHSRNTMIPLTIIMAYLSGQELCNMCMVNMQWQAIVECDPRAGRRQAEMARRLGIKKKMEKENIPRHPMKRRGSGEGRSLTGAMGLLAEVQHQASPQRKILRENRRMSEPVTSAAAQTLQLSQKYWKEAEGLKNEEALRKCPRCDSPAKADATQERAKCTTPTCHFDFCIKCRNGFHGSKDCSLSVVCKKPSSKTKVGGQKSKKNLRRL